MSGTPRERRPVVDRNKEARPVVWSGRPAVGAYAFLFLLDALITIIILVAVELYLGGTAAGSGLFPSSVTISGVNLPYPVEIVTSVVIILILVAKLLDLALLRARNRYDLYSDGLYINSGIANLENVFIAPMAFSDARLLRPWTMRLINLGNIIVDANDGRHFRLQLVRDPMEVQSLIRRTLAHPTFRTEPVNP